MGVLEVLDLGNVDGVVPKELASGKPTTRRCLDLTVLTALVTGCFLEVDVEVAEELLGLGWDFGRKLQGVEYCVDGESGAVLEVAGDGQGCYGGGQVRFDLVPRVEDGWGGLRDHPWSCGRNLHHGRGTGQAAITCSPVITWMGMLET